MLALATTESGAQDVDPTSTPIAAAPPTTPTTAAPPSTATPPVAPPENAEDSDEAEPSNRVTAPPPIPATPPRAQAAVLRVLDKVTAETMAFAAPIGQRVRYKSLVFEVKTCVTRGVGDPEPDPSAYLIITSDAGAATGALLGPREVFRGWMFANAPGLHPLKHPVYDAWLVSCSASLPPT